MPARHGLSVLAALLRRLLPYLRAARPRTGRSPRDGPILPSHFALIHLIAVVVCAVRFGTIDAMLESPTLDRYPVTFPPGWGFALPVIYLVWIGVVLAMYPLCRWYAALKQRRRDWWLSYV